MCHNINLQSHVCSHDYPGGRGARDQVGGEKVLSECPEQPLYSVDVKYSMPTFHVTEVLTLTFCTWFEHISMLVILLNCVTLGMFQPCEDISCLSDWCRILQVSRPYLHLHMCTLLFCCNNSFVGIDCVGEFLLHHCLQLCIYSTFSCNESVSSIEHNENICNYFFVPPVGLVSFDESLLWSDVKS